MQDGAIAAQSRGEVDSVLVLYPRCGLRRSVDGEAEVAVYFFCHVWFEDECDVGVGGVDVVGVFDHRGVDVVIVVFAHEEDVAGWAWPLEGEEVGIACFYMSIVRSGWIRSRVEM